MVTESFFININKKKDDIKTQLGCEYKYCDLHRLFNKKEKKTPVYSAVIKRVNSF